MMNSKIPLPSKRSAQSSIPVPVKCLGTMAKKMPLNSNEAFVSKKQISVKQVLTKPLKVGEKDVKGVKRLPSKCHDSTQMAQKKLPSKSHDAKRVADLNKKTTSENKFIKQAKPAPVRKLSKSIAPHSKSVTEKENNSKRFSSLKPYNDKKTMFLNNKSKTTNKSAIQSKSTKKSTEISTYSYRENRNRKLPVSEKPEKTEKIAVVAPIKQTNLVAKSGVDESEFKDSRFFKSLILNQRELSPGIIKMCSEAKFSSSRANNLQQPQQKFSLHFQSAEEFVEEVKRNSSKYFRLNGKLVPHSPYTLKLKDKSAEDFVDEVKRNSTKFLQRKGNPLFSPCLAPKNSLFQRMAQDIVSVKENLDIKLVDEVRRLSECRKQSSQNADSFMTSRRWTCNVPSKPSIANMTTSEIAAELRILSEIRRESGVQLFKKATVLEHQYSVEKLNPYQKALREIESLTAKKKDKTKKKVTFLIPSPGSPDLATATAAITEAKLSDISEGSSQSCTPELDLDSCKVKMNPQSNDGGQNAGDTSVNTTPELNLTTYKLNFDSLPKESNVTLPFDVLHKSDKSSDTQTISLEVVENISAEQCSLNFNANSNNFKSDFLSSKFSSLEISGNNACSAQSISDNDLPSFENYLTNINSNSYSEFSKVKSTDSLFQSAHSLMGPSNYQLVTQNFNVNTEKKINTPHPIALHSKSKLPSSVSPSFLSGKFSTLNSNAPIYTPLVLKSLSRSPEVNIKDIRQRLDFNEKPNLFMERQESQIILQTIPTIQKMNDFLCDQECIILTSQSSEEEEKFFRNLRNPIATILNNGDEMHFIPVHSP